WFRLAVSAKKAPQSPPFPSENDGDHPTQIFKILCCGGLWHASPTSSLTSPQKTENLNGKRVYPHRRYLMTSNDLPKLDLYRRIVQAKLFIDSNFDERIDAGEIADEACYSKFHFIRTFKSIYGWTPHQYLTHVRVERAKEMLEQGVSVTEACFSIGFDSLRSS